MAVSASMVGWLVLGTPPLRDPPNALHILAQVDTTVVAPPTLTLLQPTHTAADPPSIAQAAFVDLVRMSGRACAPLTGELGWADPPFCTQGTAMHALWAIESAKTGSIDCLEQYATFLAGCDPTHPDRLVIPLLAASTERSASPTHRALAPLDTSVALVLDTDGWLAHQPDPHAVRHQVTAALVGQAAEIQLHWWPTLPPQAAHIVASLYTHAAATAPTPASREGVAKGRLLALLAAGQPAPRALPSVP